MFVPNRRLVLKMLLAAAILETVFSVYGSFVRAANSAAGSPSEAHARNVDRAALSAQEKSITTLAHQLRRRRGTAEEPVFLTRLAELQVQRYAILFRISHASGSASGYRKAVEEAIRTLSELIARFPDSSGIPQALFERGKSFSEIDKNREAKRDFLALIRNHPSFEMLDSARMAVAEIDIAANDHAAAVVQLREVEKNPESAHYPFALYKLAWSHLNLKAVPEAIRYLEKHIRYYATAKYGDERAKEDDAVSAGLVENSLSDLTLFYFEGFEAKAADLSIERALPYFRSMADGPRLGKMLLGFAKLLGAHNHYRELVAWKNAVLKELSNLPEASAITLLVFDYQFAHRDFASLAATTGDLVRQREGKDTASKEAIRDALLRAAMELQELVLKNKNADEVQSLAGPLSTLYNAVVEVLDESDPRGAKARLNLAETLFQVKDFAAATKYYRWVVTNVPANTKEIDLEKISLEAIASRYEELKAQRLMPVTLEAKAISGESEHPLSTDSPLSEWLAWIDAHERAFAAGRAAASPEIAAEFENFRFEAARALYAAGLTHAALERMRRFAFAKPAAKNAVASISLVLDSYVKSRAWSEAHALTRAIGDVKEWKALPLAEKAFEIGADTSYKIAESSSREDASESELRATLKGADDCAKHYARSVRHVDCLVLAGKTALLLKNTSQADGYFTKVIEDPKAAPQHLSACMLLRASIKEDNGRLVEALEDLQLYLGEAEAPNDEIVKKILHLAWLSGDAAVLKTALQKNTARAEALKNEFDRYAAFLALKEHVSEEAASRYFKKAYAGASDYKAVWALAALKSARKLPFQDRLVLLQRIGARWNDLEPADQLALVADLHQTVPKIILENRKMMAAIAPVRADQAAIERRLRLVKEVEQTVVKALTLSWAGIKVAILDAHAEAYLDFTREVRTLRIPGSLPPEEVKAYRELLTKLIRPLEEKASELHRRSLELAVESSVDAGETRPKLLSLLETDAFRSSRHEKYLALWSEARNERNFPLLFELARQAETKFKFSNDVVRTMKALSLYQAGARAEGLALLREGGVLGVRASQ